MDAESHRAAQAETASQVHSRYDLTNIDAAAVTGVHSSIAAVITLSPADTCRALRAALATTADADDLANAIDVHLSYLDEAPGGDRVFAVTRPFMPIGGHATDIAEDMLADCRETEREYAGVGSCEIDAHNDVAMARWDDARWSADQRAEREWRKQADALLAAVLAVLEPTAERRAAA